MGEDEPKRSSSLRLSASPRLCGNPCRCLVLVEPSRPMAMSIAAAMRVFESGDLAGAERAFASIAGTSRDGVIARFRRAECLSRLGRHDEAVADARTAHADGR